MTGAEYFWLGVWATWTVIASCGWLFTAMTLEEYKGK
jgi:hypothetical protein